MKLNHVAILAAVGGLFAGGIASADPVLKYTFNNSELLASPSVQAETGQTGTISATGVTTGVTPVPAAWTGQSFGFSSGGVSTPVAMDISTTKSFTIDFWINAAASSGGTYIADTDGEQYGVLYGYTGTNSLSFFAQNGGANSEPAVSQVTLTPGTWTNIAYTYDGGALGTGNFTTYVNGTQQGAAVGGDIVDTSQWDTGGNYFIGGFDANGSDGFTGDLFNFAIYDTALGQSAITALQTPSAVPEPASLSLLGLGAFGLLARRRSQKA